MNLRSICLLSNLVSSHVVLTPPNTVSPDKHDKDKFKDAAAPGVLVPLGRIAKFAVQSITVFELLVIMFISDSNWPAFLPKSAGTKLVACGSHASVTHSTLLASGLMCVAAVVRWTCYRYLGRHFTFELALQKGQKLVTTGPYSVVRHPAYTGALMYIAGSVILVLGDEGSMWAQCGVWETTLGRLFTTIISVLALVAAVLFISRTYTEDEVLRKEFQAEWSLWSKKTPYRLIPLLY